MCGEGVGIAKLSFQKLKRRRRCNSGTNWDCREINHKAGIVGRIGHCFAFGLRSRENIRVGYTNDQEIERHICKAAEQHMYIFGTRLPSS